MKLWRGCGLGLGLGAWLLAAVGCGSSPNPAGTATTALNPVASQGQPRLRTMKLWLGAHELTAELALTDKERMTGMMFRTELPDNEAMLFVFPIAHRTGFWMKNTPLPLSAAYIDPDGLILELHDFEPHNTNSVTAGSDRVQFVLETTRGWFERNHVGVGTVLRTERGSLLETFFRNP